MNHKSRTIWKVVGVTAVLLADFGAVLGIGLATKSRLEGSENVYSSLRSQTPDIVAGCRYEVQKKDFKSWNAYAETADVVLSANAFHTYEGLVSCPLSLGETFASGATLGVDSASLTVSAEAAGRCLSVKENAGVFSLDVYYYGRCLVNVDINANEYLANPFVAADTYYFAFGSEKMACFFSTYDFSAYKTLGIVTAHFIPAPSFVLIRGEDDAPFYTGYTTYEGAFYINPDAVGGKTGDYLFYLLTDGNYQATYVKVYAIIDGCALISSDGASLTANAYLYHV